MPSLRKLIKGCEWSKRSHISTTSSTKGWYLCPIPLKALASDTVPLIDMAVLMLSMLPGYCKVISLQLIKINDKKKRPEVSAFITENSVLWDSVDTLSEAPGYAGTRRGTKTVWFPLALALFWQPIGSHGNKPWSMSQPWLTHRSRSHPTEVGHPHRLAAPKKGDCSKPLHFGMLCYTVV